MAGHSASLFISYSHKDKELVHQIAELLQSGTFHVWLDEWDVRTGDSLVQRVAEAIDRVDFVVAFISEASADSEWCRKEVSLAMTGELAEKGIKVLPVRVGNVTMPATLRDKKYLDASGLSPAEISERLAEDMRSHLTPAREIPPRRRPPQPVSASAPQDGPIRMVGIDAKGVTSPRLDGTPGSALYRVPILLSRQPEPGWAQLMVQNWDRPPVFTSMHRPGIGSVVGRTFVLDGTTLEELERHHLETLELAINETNRQWDELVRRQKAREAAAAAQRAAREEQNQRTLDRLNSRFGAASGEG